jgi:hypothetical protein
MIYPHSKRLNSKKYWITAVLVTAAMIAIVELFNLQNL